MANHVTIDEEEIEYVLLNSLQLTFWIEALNHMDKPLPKIIDILLCKAKYISTLSQQK